MSHLSRPTVCPAELELGGLTLRCTRQCEAHTNHEHVRHDAAGRMVVVSWKAAK